MALEVEDAGRKDDGSPDIRGSGCRCFVLLEVADATAVESGGAVVLAPAVPMLTLLLLTSGNSGAAAVVVEIALALRWENVKKPKDSWSKARWVRKGH